MPKKGLTLKRILIICIIIWCLGKICSYTITTFVFDISRPWGPEIRGVLPDGGYIVFQSRPTSIRETEDRLIWVNADGKRHEFMVDEIHAGYAYILIKIKDDNTGIWVEDHSPSSREPYIGASLDLITGEFRAEFDTQFDWAQLNEGNIIAKGKTYKRELWRILLPW